MSKQFLPISSMKHLKNLALMTQPFQRQGLASLKSHLKRAMMALKPPPRLSVSEWADLQRRLDSQTSAEAGIWRTSRAEYQRGIMDACSDQTIKEVVVMAGAQLGKSEALLNIIGFHIDHDPCPILMLDRQNQWPNPSRKTGCLLACCDQRHACLVRSKIHGLETLITPRFTRSFPAAVSAWSGQTARQGLRHAR